MIARDVLKFDSPTLQWSHRVKHSVWFEPQHLASLICTSGPTSSDDCSAIANRVTLTCYREDNDGFGHNY